MRPKKATLSVPPRPFRATLRAPLPPKRATLYFKNMIFPRARFAKGFCQPFCRKPFLLPSDAEIAKLEAVMEKAAKMI